jgi:CheY-like chemotaxis protein
VLVVTSDEGMRELLQLVIEDEAGARVVAGWTAHEALEQAKAKKPALILLDWVPGRGSDGSEAARVLKADAATRDIPVVALVYYPEEREQALQAGCVDSIDKAFDIDALVAKVQQYLPGRRAKAIG